VQTLRYRLDTTANGANQDWSVLYSTNAYEAVNRESADTTYIQSATLNHRSDFTCGNGPHPELGFVSAITVHYRLKTTDTSGAPVVAVDILRAGTPLAIGWSVAPTAAAGWIDGEYRLGTDPATSARFIPGSLDDMGVMVQVTTAPTTGYVQVSRAWLEVEWTLSPEFYDPVYHAVVPDSVTGAMTWNKTGTQSAALAAGQLVLTDASASDWISYNRTILQYGANYLTEVSTRFSLSGPSTGFNYRAAYVDDASNLVELCCFTDSGGDPYIGLITGGLDHDDPDDYLDTYAIDWTVDHHYRLIVDREVDPGDSFNVRVYVDYEATPVMEVNYFKFDGSAGSAELGFGTGSAALKVGQIKAYVDFFDWWHYRKSGSNWRYWYAAEVGNNTVSVNSSDTMIVKPVTITPPGIVTGQSQYCCELAVQDLTDECSVRTYFDVPSSAGTYNITLVYRIATFGEKANLQVQRTSDHYYWNEGLSTWQAASSVASISYSGTRTTATLMTNITTPTPDKLIITVRNSTAASAAHWIYLYKVDVRD